MLGIDNQEIDSSLITLRRMADGLGARVKVARRIQISGDGVKEIPLDQEPPIAWSASVKEEPPIPQPSASRTGEVPVQAAKPNAHTGRRRLTRKDRRQARRDKEQWLRDTSKAGQAGDDDAFGLSVLDGVDILDQDSSTTSSISTPAYIAVTPPADEIPQLSHSPSPPSSTSGSHSVYYENSRITTIASSGHSASHITTSSIIVPSSPLPCRRSILHTEKAGKAAFTDIIEAEQADHALRRHLRKQWKKERQHQKQVERARHLANSHHTRRSRTHNGVPVYTYVSNDTCLEGLAALFGDITLDADDAGNLDDNDKTTDLQKHGDSRSNKDEASWKWKRRRSRGPAFSPTSTPLSGTLTPSMAINIASPLTSVGVAAATGAPKLRVPPFSVSKSAAGAQRYAIECVIQMSSHAPEPAGSDEEGELAFFGGSDGYVEEDDDTRCVAQALATATVSVGGTARACSSKQPSRPASQRGQLQTFIDFETVWDELEMDL